MTCDEKRAFNDKRLQSQKPQLVNFYRRNVYDNGKAQTPWRRTNLCCDYNALFELS